LNEHDIVRRQRNPLDLGRRVTVVGAIYHEDGILPATADVNQRDTGGDVHCLHEEIQILLGEKCA